MQTIQRIKQELRKGGLGPFLRHMLHSLAGLRYNLVREPAEALQPCPATDAFMSTAKHVRIAVQIHLFYPQLAEELIEATNRIPYPFDCYISTDTQDKAAVIEQAFSAKSRAHQLEVKCYPNRGRDLAPFLCQLAPQLHAYDYVCHLHGKYSAHSAFGNEWRTYLLSQLLASPAHVAAMLARMEGEPSIGLVFPKTLKRLKRFGGWRGNRPQAVTLLKQMGLHLSLPRSPVYPAGNMFWARTDAVAPAFECGLSFADFPEEEGQTEGTTAHCLERCWVSIAQARGYGYLRMVA